MYTDVTVDVDVVGMNIVTLEELEELDNDNESYSISYRWQTELFARNVPFLDLT